MKKVVLVYILLFVSFYSFSQSKKDSLRITNGNVYSLPVQDTFAQSKGRSPKSAAIRSALVPGLGQIYNRKYWKLPLVYGALGITGGILIHNLSQYKKIQFAYNTLVTKDSANFQNVVPELQPFIERGDIRGLQRNRTYFRQNIDYSMLFFIIFWGLNVVDAAVDAHLSTFNVNDDLSFQVKPVLQPGVAGFGLVVNL